MEDERRMRRQKEQERNTREFLERQMQEKDSRRVADKRNHAEQATMWQCESEEYDCLEKERNGR